MSEKIVHITEENYVDIIVNATTPVLIDFYADWCGPCQALAPVMESLAEKFDGKVRICKLDVGANKSLAVQHKVLSIPTLLFIKGGKMVDRITGAPTESELEEKLNGLL